MMIMNLINIILNNLIILDRKNMKVKEILKPLLESVDLDAEKVQ